MRRKLVNAFFVLIIVAGIVFVLKSAQLICWHYKVIAPPSLESWDPHERVEAARLAIKTFGGKQ